MFSVFWWRRELEQLEKFNALKASKPEVAVDRRRSYMGLLLRAAV
jgi:hypothetical protein